MEGEGQALVGLQLFSSTGLENSSFQAGLQLLCVIRRIVPPCSGAESRASEEHVGNVRAVGPKQETGGGMLLWRCLQVR